MEYNSYPNVGTPIAGLQQQRNLYIQTLSKALLSNARQEQRLLDEQHLFKQAMAQHMSNTHQRIYQSFDIDWDALVYSRQIEHDQVHQQSKQIRYGF